MATFLFDKIIFGPVRSRRLGLSLGVNLLAPEGKLCNFNCIYCECGWNEDHPGGAFNGKEEVLRRLEEKLAEMKTEGELPDVITFAGNGEPTMHPGFPAIIDGTIEIRDRMTPAAKIAVLSNAAMSGRENVREALMKVDRNILKLDSARDETVKLINQPNNARTVAETIELMKLFDGRLIMQTLFLRGDYNGRTVDNTTPEELSAWLAAVREIGPSEVMIYSLDRDTPVSGLQKISHEELEKIAEKVRESGVAASVA